MSIKPEVLIIFKGISKWNLFVNKNTNLLKRDCKQFCKKIPPKKLQLLQKKKRMKSYWFGVKSKQTKRRE